MSDDRVHAEPEPAAAVVAVPAPLGPAPVTGQPSPLGRPLTPAAVLALQRTAGNTATTAVLARQVADPPAPPAAAPAPTASVAPAFTVELPEALGDKLKLEAGKASFVKGSLAVKGEVQFVGVDSGQAAPSTTVGPSTGSQGVKVETERAGKTWASDLMKSMGMDEVTEALTFEAGAKKLEVSVSCNGKVKTSVPWLTPVVEGKAIAVSVEWDKLAETTVGGIELSGGAAGEGRVTLAGVDMIAKPKITITGTAQLNWAKIAAEIGKRGAQEAGKGALTAAGGEVLVVDTAGVAASAAAIAVPAAAAVALGFGFFQGIKNAGAAREAANAGVAARRQAETFARAYARQLTGGKGDDPAAVAQAETQIAAVTSRTHAPREMVIDMIVTEQGGYAAIYGKNLKRIKDVLYDEAVRTFNESHQEDFGLVESLGDDWGMKGVFQSTLRIVLYGGDEPPP